MDIISLLRARRIFSKKLIDSFVNLTMDETLEKICNHFFVIWYSMDFSDSHVAFAAGFDATVVVKL